jgi:two-component system, chemotaxis family, sensor kinase CheA
VSLQASIDAVAKAVALTDASDLPGLVALQELLLKLASEASDAQLSRASDVSAQAADLVEHIVLREIQDTTNALRTLGQAVEFVQRVHEADERGDTVGDIPSPFDNPVPAPADAAPSTIAPSAEWRAQLGLVAAGVARHGTDATAGCDPVAAKALESLLTDLASRSDACGMVEAASVCRSVAGTIQATREASRPMPVQSIRTALDWLQAAAGTCEAATEGQATAAPTRGAPDDAEPVAIGADSDETLNEFLTEAREHLSNAEGAALQLERNPDEKEEINTVFRAFHTIKGVAGFMALTPIVEVAHAAETLLDKARSGSYRIGREGLDLILGSCDMLNRMVMQMQGGDAPTKGEMRRLVERLAAAAEGRSVAPAHNAARSVPPEMAASAVAAARALTERFPASGASADSEQSEASSDSTTSSTSGSSAGSTAAEDAEQAQRNHARRVDQTVKVSTHRMDSLLNMVGELVIAQLMVQQDPVIAGVSEQRVQRNLGQMAKIVRDLQEVAMSLRMVTLKATFQKMSRLVRDVSIKAGKRVDLVLEGEDTELDRNVVEEIADPLVHMIRNACDHGIEPESERIAKGKSPAGTLCLRAFHRGGMIVIEVADDGRGLQREKILKKCLEKGLIPADRALDEIPDSEVYNYIFLPGFSTADKITDISGRGVGMDVVKRNIEALRGKIEIRSTPGHGSTFTMQLPLTMAIIDGMLVRVGGQRYVVPTLAIERSFRPKPEEIHTFLGKGELAMVRGHLLPIRRLNRIFGMREGIEEICKGLLLVVESGKERCCLLVDEILGQQQVVIKNLGLNLGSPDSGHRQQGISGGAILGDGRVALIVDIGALLQDAGLASAA